MLDLISGINFLSHSARLAGANQMYSDGSALLLPPCTLWSEAWTLLQEDLRRLDAFHMPSQRMILGIR